MSIFDRDALEQSPLADLHAIASELSIDSFRRMRKADLIDAILARQAGQEPAGDAKDEAAAEQEEGPDQEGSPGQEGGGARRGRWRRGGRGRRGPDDGPSAEDEAPEPAEPEEPARKRREPAKSRQEAEPHEEGGKEIDQAVVRAEAEMVEGVVELLPGGSGFVRVNPPGPSDEDVYISSAQVKRCELVTGDRVSGPRRPPRRSERFASLQRVESVNGRPATELADGLRFDQLSVAFPDRRFPLPAQDELLTAIDQTAPIGRGSRVTIAGPPGAGKTEALRRLAAALAGGEDEQQVRLALLGVRPEEIPEWEAGPVTPAVALSFASSPEAQSEALDGVVEQARRLVARGAHAVLLVDTIDAVGPGAARKAMASARNVVDGGSLTVVVTARAPLGGETTVLALSQPPPGTDAAPVLNPEGSWTMRRQRLG